MVTVSPNQIIIIIIIIIIILRRTRRYHRDTAAKKMQASFVQNCLLIVPWDGKMLPALNVEEAS